jgi:rRNA maturation RNase YbeY
MGQEGVELSVVLTGDLEIQQLNREYRGKNKPTDVLSFPQSESGSLERVNEIGREEVAGDSGPPRPLGDIVLSLETARRDARAMRTDFPAHLRKLLIHGLLHLLGYDHERSPAEARRQFARERELAARLSEAEASHCNRSHKRRASAGQKRTVFSNLNAGQPI